MKRAMASETRIKKKSVTILKVIKPNHFIVKEIPGLQMSRSAQLFIELEARYLNQYDLVDIVPKTLDYPIKGSVVLVKPEGEDDWYRGRVVSILETSKGTRISTFLVDYGRLVAVCKEWIRDIPVECSHIPFQAMDFILPNVQPASLVCDQELRLSRGASGVWDVSAIEEIKKIVQVDKTGEVLIELQDAEGVCYGQLFVEHFGETINVNQYLLERKFAFPLASVSITAGGYARMVTEELLVWDDTFDIPVTNRPKSSMSGRNSRASRGRDSTLVQSLASFCRTPEKISHHNLSFGSSSTLSCSSQNSDCTITEISNYQQFEASRNEQEVPLPDLDFQLLNKAEPGSGLIDSESVSSTCSLSQRASDTSHSLNGTKSAHLSMESLIGKGRGQKLLDNIRTMNKSRLVKPCGEPKVGLPVDASEREATRRILLSQDLRNSNGRSDFCTSLVSGEVSQEYSKSISKTIVETVPNLNSEPNLKHSSGNTPVRVQRTSPKERPINSEQFFGARPKHKNSFYQSTPKFITPILRPSSISPEKKCSPTSVEKIRTCNGQNSPTSIRTKTPTSNSDVRHSSPKKDKSEGKTPVCNEENRRIPSVEPNSSIKENSKHIRNKFSSNHRRIKPNLFCSLDQHRSFKLLLGNPVSTLLRFGSLIPKAVDSLATVSLAKPIKECLDELRFPAPSTIQSHVWPAVLRGRSVVAIAPMHSGKSLACIVPLLSLLLQPEDYETLKDRKGPLALVLCSSWTGCQNLYSQCLLFVPEYFHSKIQCMFGGSGIKNQEFALVGGCDLLITTPACYLHMQKIIHMNRCCHVMFDDGDILTECFTNEVREIMLDYENQCKQRPSSVPSQILVCSSRCTPAVKSFIGNAMRDPIVFVSSFMEAAIYARLPVYPKFYSKALLSDGVADLIRSGGKRRTVICTTNADVAIGLTNILMHHSTYALAIHEHLEHFRLKAMVSEWEDPSCGAVLVVSDFVLPELDITKAEWLIHYDLPEESRLIFGYRFRCLIHNLQIKADSNDTRTKSVGDSLCHILLTEDFQKQSVDILRFLNRMKVAPPQELKELVHQKQVTKLLCPSLKSFGSCHFMHWCNFRHFFIKSIDQPSLDLPHWGEATVHITHVLDASHFYGYLVEHRDPTNGTVLNKRKTYLDLHMQLNLHYSKASNRIEHLNAAEGDICGLAKAEGTHHRVKVSALRIPDSPVLMKKASVFFLDEGCTEEVNLDLLLKLPEKLLSIPSQAIEIFACRVQPLDGHQQWTPQASSRVHEQIMDKNLTGNVTMCLNNSLFLDPIVLRTEVLKSTYMHTFNLTSSLLKDNLAASNTDHIIKLKAACHLTITLTEPTLGEKHSSTVPPSDCVENGTHLFEKGQATGNTVQNLIASPSRKYPEPNQAPLNGVVENGLHSPESGQDNVIQKSLQNQPLSPTGRNSEPNEAIRPQKETLHVRDVSKSSVAKYENCQNNPKPGDNHPRCASKVPIPAGSSYEMLNTLETPTVYISAADTPHHFHIQNTNSYDQLLDQNERINYLVHNFQLEAAKQPEIGTVCVALFDDDQDNWFRARVIKVFPVEIGYESFQDKFELFFLDFGDTCMAKRTHLFEITRELLKLPFQAQECSLFGICANEGKWADNISEVLLDLTRDEDDIYKEFQLKVIQQFQSSDDPNKFRYAVQIWQPQLESLASRLVNLGLAVKSKKKSVSLTSENEADCESSIVSLSPEPDSKEKDAFYSVLAMQKYMTRDAKVLTETSDDESIRESRKKPLRKPILNHVTKRREEGSVNESIVKKNCESKTSIPPKIIELHSVRDQNMPNLEVVENYSTSHLSPVQWYQTPTEVLLTVLIPCCQEYELFVSSSTLNLRLLRGDKYFVLREELFDQVVAQESRSIPHEMNIRIRLTKLVQRKWLRLTKSDKKVRHITYHYDHLETTSCDETLTEGGGETDPKVVWKTLNYDPCNMDDITASGGDESDMDRFFV